MHQEAIAHILRMAFPVRPIGCHPIGMPCQVILSNQEDLNQASGSVGSFSGFMDNQEVSGMGVRNGIGGGGQVSSIGITN